MDDLRTFFRHPHSAFMSDLPCCDFVPAEILSGERPLGRILADYVAHRQVQARGYCVRPVKHVFKVA
jgi:hypothetical protein